MKKALAILSICAIASPLLTAHAADKKSHKKKHHHAVAAKKFKDSAPTVAAKDAPATTNKDWFSMSNVSGTVGLTSNYMFRGISLSENNPALQGGFTYTFPVGLYLSTWGSNANFTVPGGKTATGELDAIVGYHNGIGDNFTYDISMDRYGYPGARNGNYNELIAVLTYSFFQLTEGYTSNYSGFHSRGLYSSGTVTLNVPPAYIFHLQDVSVTGEYGHYSLGKAGGNSYSDFSLGVNKKINNTYTLSLLGTGTNDRAKLPPYDGNQIVGTLTAVF